MEWRNLYRGLLMGITDLIPGVSGGTVAFLFGIYDELLEAISGFFSRRWKSYLGFLLPLAIGIGVALFVFSRLIDYLLTDYFEPTQFFFLGLIIGVIPFLFKQADVKHKFTTAHFGSLVFVALLLALLDIFKAEPAGVAITTLTIPTLFGLFFAGWLASMAMLLPGISGSFILLVLGVYATAINALKTFNLPMIAVIGTGVIIGFIVSSKGIRYLLTHYTTMTYAIILGLIIGSVFVIFPGLPLGGSTLVFCIVTFMIGLLCSFLFSRISS